MDQKKVYEAPKIQDLEELGIRGQFPLGLETCSEGTGGVAHSCTYGTGTRVHNPCEFGAN